MATENVSSFEPTSALSPKFEDVSMVFPSCISTQVKVDPDFNETNIVNGNNEELEEGKTTANDEELNQLKFSDLPVKQELNSAAILTQLKIDLDFPETSISLGHNKELEEGETPTNYDGFNNFKYSELPVKQEFNSSAILTGLKPELEFPGTSVSDVQNKDDKISILDYKYGFPEFRSCSMDYQLKKRLVYQPTLESNSDLEDTHKKENLSGGEQYECHICEKKFAKMHKLKLHQRIHPGEKPYECEICEKKFSHTQKLKLHERIHSGEKPYECKICEKKFSQTGSLKLHERIHSGEKPYECRVCEKKFSILHSFKTHQRIHSGEKPHECKICEKKFSQYKSRVAKTRKKGQSPRWGVKSIEAFMDQLKELAEEETTQSCTKFSITMCELTFKQQTCSGKCENCSTWKTHLKEIWHSL
ncbi:zinc finger protein 82 homolog isoform X2 [Artemia franciscana]|uniref:zinc finger protein 82 homolog isoform X2 n=1 Tax=Artemia franciscana TaxID=6661 RepID=UPI0032DB4259